MLNLIRMNLIKMFQMKCVYVMLIICIGVGAIFVGDSQDTSTDELEQQLLAEQTGQQDEHSVEVGITMSPAGKQQSLVLYMSDFFSSGALMIMVGIFMAILACSERESGFLKNLACCSQRRWQIVAARLVPAVLFILIIGVGFFFSTMAVNAITGTAIPVGDLAAFLPALGIQLLLHTAFAALMLLAVEVTKSLLLSVIFSIFTGFGLVAFVISFILPKLTEFMIVGRIQATTLPLDISLIPGSFAVGVIALIGYTVLGGVVFQKRDTY